MGVLSAFKVMRPKKNQKHDKKDLGTMNMDSSAALSSAATGERYVVDVDEPNDEQSVEMAIRPRRRKESFSPKAHFKARVEAPSPTESSCFSPCGNMCSAEVSVGETLNSTDQFLLEVPAKKEVSRPMERVVNDLGDVLSRVSSISESVSEASSIPSFDSIEDPVIPNERKKKTSKSKAVSKRKESSQSRSGHSDQKTKESKEAEQLTKIPSKLPRAKRKNNEEEESDDEENACFSLDLWCLGCPDDDDDDDGGGGKGGPQRSTTTAQTTTVGTSTLPPSIYQRLEEASETASRT